MAGGRGTTSATPLAALVVLVVVVLTTLAPEEVHGYVNWWDGYLNYRCSAGYGLSYLQSYHSNNREDRRWNFNCAKVGSGYTYNVQSSGGWDYSKYDRPIDFSCATNYYLERLESVHSNHREDRVWRFECRRANHIRLLNCGITGYINNWDGYLSYSVPSDRIITGLASYHSNHREDRRWRVRYCGVECDLGDGVVNSGGRGCTSLSESTIPNWSYVNNFRAPFWRSCPSGQRIDYFYSYHDNGQEDRRWKFACYTPYNTGSFSNTGWSTPTYDRLRSYWAYVCPSQAFITGVRAAYVADDYDRVYSFRCSRMENTVLNGCFWTSTQNNYDGGGGVRAYSRRAVAGIRSWYSSTHRDRVWSYYMCNLDCASGTVRNPDGVCRAQICPTLSLTNGRVTGSCTGLYGDDCRYVGCNEGYAPSSSPGTRTCQSDGSWSGNAITCQRIRCGRLSNPLIVFSGQCSGDYGDSCTYSRCVDGYALRGSTTTRTCGASGWSGSAPTCERLTCGQRSTPSNSRLSGSCSGNLGDRCTVTCASGYVMSPSSGLSSPSVTSRCSQSGSGTNIVANWNNLGYSCQPARCGSISLSNGQTSGSCSGNYGDQCTYAGCDREYAFASGGSTTRTCTISGNTARWTGSAKSCQRVTCPRLSTNNGQLSSACTSGTLYSTCELTCNSGYWPGGSGATSLRCNLDSAGHSASWSNSLQACKEVRCPPLTIANGQTGGSCFGYVGNVCHYSSCIDGFRLSTSGDDTRTCVQDGPVANWDGGEKTCLDVLEGAPNAAFDAICAAGTTMVGLYGTPTGSGFEYAYLCQETGDISVGRIFSRHEALHRTRDTVNLQCDSDVYALSGVRASWTGSDANRMWTYECSLVAGADLINCREESGSYNFASEFAFNAPEKRVITGIRNPSSGTGGYRVRTCEVRCRESDGYFETASGKCERLMCGVLELENGAVSGDCNGRIGDSCSYTGCDPGYEMTDAGDATRTCRVSNGQALWSGSAKMCERIVTTIAPTTPHPCDGLRRSLNATTCRARCNAKDEDSTFFREYEGCTHVCTCGCRTQYKIAKNANRCASYCNSIDSSLTPSFSEKHDGCRGVCQCVEEVTDPTQTPPDELPVPDPDDALLLNFPYEKYGYEVFARGNLDGVGSPRRSRAAFNDNNRLLSVDTVGSVPECLQLCDATAECNAAFVRRFTSSLECRRMTEHNGSGGTSTRSMSLTKLSAEGSQSEASGKASGTVETLAGDGSTDWNNDASSPTGTGLNQMGCVTQHGPRFLIVSLISEHRVIRVDLFDDSVTVLAGTGTAGSGGVGGDATSAQLDRPTCAVADDFGNIYIAEEGNHRVSFIDVDTGKLSVVVGTGKAGQRGIGSAGTAAQINAPTGLAFDGRGFLYISDAENHVVYRYNPITSIVHIAVGTLMQRGFGGDGGAADEARLDGPMGIACAANNNELFIADTGNNRVRSVGLVNNVIDTVAGAGPPGDGDGLGVVVAATEALLYAPEGVALNDDGSTLAIADTRNNAVRMVDLSEDSPSISRVIGSGHRGYNGDSSTPAATKLNNPVSVSFTNDGDAVVFADQRNRRVRRVWL